MERNLHIHDYYRRDGVRSFLLLIALFLVGFLSALEAQAQTYPISLPTYKKSGWFSLPGTRTAESPGWTQGGLTRDLYNNYTDSNDPDNETGSSANFDTAGDSIVLHFTGTPGTLTYYSVLRNTTTLSTGQFVVEQSMDGKSYTRLRTFTNTDLTTSTQRFVDNPISTTRYIRFYYITKVSAGSVALDNVRLTAAPAPEITVEQNATPYENGTTYNYGSKNIYSTTEATFTIRNTGTAPLNISSVTLGGADADQFQITSELTFPIAIAAGESTTLNVAFKPTSATTAGRSATITISNDDADEAQYIVNLSGTATAPDISVWDDNTNIIYDNGTTYNYGSKNIYSTTEATFTIRNTGTAPLNISSVTLGGADADQFQITSELTFPIAIAAGESTTLNVAFKPTSASTAGRSATITISNDDADEAQYVINLTGTAVSPITEIVYPDGFPGDPVTIKGTNLGNVTSVKFNGTEAVIISVSDTEIATIVPEGATTGPVTVYPVQGTTATSPEEFVVFYPITIESFSPPSGSIGDTVIISGENFTQYFGMAFLDKDSKYVYAENLVLLSHNKISGTVPAGAVTGVIYVFDVASPDGVATATQFAVIEDEPLPVELISFTGSRSAKGVQLNWQTASESNNDYFQVEVATSMQDEAFKPVIKVLSKVHNSAEVTSYEALDTTPPVASTVYYRLKQVDLDGKFEYSKTIAVETQSSYEVTSPLKVYPNPFTGSDHLNVEVAATRAGNFTTVLYHISGKKAFEKVVAVESGVSTIKLPLLEKLPAGLYILSTELNGQVNTMRVVKQ